jgi:hypothetical protein
MRNPSGQFVKDGARKVLGWLRWLSPLTWLREMRMPIGADGLTEAYAIGVTLVQVLLYWCTWQHVPPLAAVLSAWLLTEMLVALLDIQLFHRERVDKTKSEGKPYTPLDPARSIILFALNFVQAVFAFALFYNYLYRMCDNYFELGVPSLSRLDWLNFSTMTLTTVAILPLLPFGTSPSPLCHWRRCLASSSP